MKTRLPWPIVGLDQVATSAPYNRRGWIKPGSSLDAELGGVDEVPVRGSSTKVLACSTTRRTTPQVAGFAAEQAARTWKRLQRPGRSR
ncbi:hypothetical protein ACRAWD_05675 [Caulobacter segnis]